MKQPLKNKIMNDDGKFCIAGLSNPPAELCPGYFWLINDRMEEKELFRQLKDMFDHGAKSVCFHPLPPEMRPETFGAAMSPAYLSSEYFELVKKIIGECHRLGMNFWLYDEGGWPSGNANGEVYARNPSEYSPKGITYRDFHVVQGESYSVPADVICAAIRTPNGWKTYRPGQTIPDAAPDSILRVFFIERGNSYADLLSPQAMETFIRLTHERYAEIAGRYFGNTIRFAFTDEPAMTFSVKSRRTWTSDMPEAFLRMKGYDLIPLLPELLEDAAENEPLSRTSLRIDFHDVCSRLFVDRYLLPLRDWCRRNNLLSSGHFAGENEPYYNADGGYGHILRALRSLDLPGVDTIYRQLFPERISHQFPKYASSTARQTGQRHVLSESFAIYGAGLTLAEMKWVIDQQYVRGVSISVFSNYPYSTRDHFMAICRPHFGQFHPLWKYFASFHSYVARLGYLLSRGQAVCHTAVYYDIRSIWAGGETRRKATELHNHLSETLLRCQCDFDFVDDDLLSGRGGRIENGRLAIGPMSYDRLIVPATDWMEKSALDGVAEFVRGGGMLVCVEGAIRADGGRLEIPPELAEKSQATLEQLQSLAEPVIRLQPPCGDIRVCKRVDGETAIYFITNEAKKSVQVKALFVEKTAPCVCNPDTGTLYEFPSTQSKDGTLLTLALPPWGSAAILFGVKAERKWSEFQIRDEVKLEKGWLLRPMCRYSAGEHQYEIKDMGGPLQPCELGDWRKQLGDWFSGDAEYQIEFDCPATPAGKPVKLDLGEVRYACSVEVNGHEAGTLIWMPFELRIDDLLRTGKNVIKVRVTNTFANALHDPGVVENWKNKKPGSWPLGYDAMTRQLEPESFSSGLFGPVRILFGTETNSRDNGNTNEIL